jgi:hypothetical protein
LTTFFIRFVFKESYPLKRIVPQVQRKHCHEYEEVSLDSCQHFNRSTLADHCCSRPRSSPSTLGHSAKGIFSSSLLGCKSKNNPNNSLEDEARPPVKICQRIIGQLCPFELEACPPNADVKTWCGRGESNPQGLSPDGFSYHFDFRRRLRVRGLDYPFTVAERRRCCPSSLYTFPCGLGSGLPVERVPRI